MGRHDETAHYLHVPKQLKFKQLKPHAVQQTNTNPKSKRLGEMNRRG